MLMSESEKRLKALVIAGLDLHVEIHNTKAQQLYRSCGFTDGYTHLWMYKPVEKKNG